VSETVVGGVPPAEPAARAAPGAGPWTLAWRRLLRNKIALVALGVFVLIVLVCLAAPIYAHDIAHTDPFRSNLNGTTIVNGKTVPVMQQTTGGIPPTISSAPTPRDVTSPRGFSTEAATR
jgi:peptide/nickel transport system permease protein